MTVECPCGCGRRIQNPLVREIVERWERDLGPMITVRCSGGAWRVPRVYIALHGLKARELPALAQQYGFKRVVGPS